MRRHAAVLTPLRELAVPEVDGCRVLSQGGISWRDSSEDYLFEVVRDARDLSSLSDELEQAATTWPERYHLSKSRANVLRPFLLDQELTVLEVGAGCGAVTRYLGEVCGVVDALEPVPERARVARARTRDLDNVEVFVGGIADVPPGAAYDLVIVVGVLEYVGEGSANPDPYVQFLARLAQVLRPGGRVICAIENRLGVKYLAGSPEDHTSRVFDGLEGYPRGGPARTFTRKELATLFEHAGLQPTFFHAFPDYKLARLVSSDSLLQSPEDQSLAWRLPHFPSPDWIVPRPRLADERSLWKSIVEAGLGGHFSNSFVIVASAESAQDLWSPDLVAAFYNCQRRALFATETRVRRSASGLDLERLPVARRQRRVECGALVHELSDSHFIPGQDITDVLTASDENALQEWLRSWRQLVAQEISSGGSSSYVSIDILPHNLVVRDSGELVIIDQEWWHRDYTEREVIERGILWLALRVADLGPPERWGAERVSDLARVVGTMVGLEPDGKWLHLVLEREAALQVQVHDSPPGGSRWESALKDYRNGLRSLLDRRLADTSMGMREHEVRANLEALVEESRAQVAGLEALIEESRARVAGLEADLAQRDSLVLEKDSALAQKDSHIANTEAALHHANMEAASSHHELEQIRNSVGYRLLEQVRRPIRWLLPPGSWRSAPFRVLLRPVRWLLRQR